MKYLIIGAGGTGGVVGFHMAQAGKDVTLIARDAHLERIQQKGLTLQTMWDENTKTIPVKASDMQHYKDRPDVILVCVKDIRWMEFTNLSVELQNRRRL